MRSQVWGVIALDAAAAAGCALLAISAGFGLTALGVGFVAVNAVGAPLLADLEFIGLRRSAPAPA